MNRFTKIILTISVLTSVLLLLNSINNTHIVESELDNGGYVFDTNVDSVKGVNILNPLVQITQETVEITNNETKPSEHKTEDAVEFDPTLSQTIHMIEDEYYSSDYSTTVLTDLSSMAITPLGYSVHENEYNDKEVMGFVTYWTLDDYESFQYDKLSTLAYFSLTCSINGDFLSDQSGYNEFYSSDFSNMVTLAHQNDVKVVLVVKNFDPKSIRDIVANTNGAGDNLINNIVSKIETHGLDGVNIDFEYVGNATYPVNDSLRSNFVSWHDKLAKRIHQEFPSSHVSTDVFGSSGVGYTAYDMTGLGNTDIDYIMMMTYDYINKYYQVDKFITPMSPLYGNYNWNLSNHVSTAATQAGSEKIIMGVPYYGIDMPVQNTQSSTYNAYVVNTESGYIETYAQIVNPIYDEWHNASSIKWNDTEKATWYNYLWHYSWGDQWRHAYYDDERSLDAKYDFVRDNNIGGVGIWALGYDTGYNELWNELRDNFQIAPFLILVDVDVNRLDMISILDSKGVDVLNEGEYNVWKVKPRTTLSSDMIPILERLDQVLVAGYEESSNNLEPLNNER